MEKNPRVECSEDIASSVLEAADHLSRSVDELSTRLEALHSQMRRFSKMEPRTPKGDC